MRFFVGFFCRLTCLSCIFLLRERLAAKARSLVDVELFGCVFFGNLFGRQCGLFLRFFLRGSRR